MSFTHWRHLLAAALIAGLLAHLLVRVGYGALPPLPTLAGTPLLVLAAIETILGFGLRARIERRPGSPPVEALSAARAVALAKASSLAGSITAGAWLGVLGYLLPLRAEVAAAAIDSIAAMVGVVCAATLVAAALWLEYCCRTPRGPHDDELHREADPR